MGTLLVCNSREACRCRMAPQDAIFNQCIRGIFQIERKVDSLHSSSVGTIRMKNAIYSTNADINVLDSNGQSNDDIVLDKIMLVAVRVK